MSVSVFATDFFLCFVGVHLCPNNQLVVNHYSIVVFLMSGASVLARKIELVMNDEGIVT